MNKVIPIILLLYITLMYFKNNKENFKLKFPEQKSLKCKCNLEKDEKKNIDKKNIEHFSNYDKSEPIIKKPIENKNYVIYDSPNEQITAEKFYLSKIKEYPINPSKEKLLHNAYNFLDYENIGLNTQKILSDKFSKELESHKFTYGIMYEN